MMLIILCLVWWNHLASTSSILPNSSISQVASETKIVENENKSISAALDASAPRLGDHLKPALEGERISKRSNDQKHNMQFSDFLGAALTVLSTFSDIALLEYVKVLDSEIRKYHYKGCKFHELLQVEGFREILRGSLEDVSNTPASVIKEKIISAQNKIKEKKLNVQERDLLDVINTLYHEEDTEKFNNTINDLESYKRKQDQVDLKKIVKAGLRSIIFDHYSKLHVNVRKDLLLQVSSFLSSFTNMYNKKTISRIKPVNADDEYKLNGNKTLDEGMVGSVRLTPTVKYMPSVPEKLTASSSEIDSYDYTSTTKVLKKKKDVKMSTKAYGEDRPVTEEAKPQIPTNEEKNIDGDIKDWIKKINNYILNPKEPLMQPTGSQSLRSNGTDAGDTEEDIQLHKKAGPKQGYNIKVVRKNNRLCEVLNVNYELIDVMNGTNTSAATKNKPGAGPAREESRFVLTSANQNAMLNPLREDSTPNHTHASHEPEDKSIAKQNKTKSEPLNQKLPIGHKKNTTFFLVSSEENKNTNTKYKTADKNRKEFDSGNNTTDIEDNAANSKTSGGRKMKKRYKKKKHGRKDDEAEEESTSEKEHKKKGDKKILRDESETKSLKPFTSPLSSEEFLVNRKMIRTARNWRRTSSTMNIANEIRKLEQELELLKSKITTGSFRAMAVPYSTVTKVVPRIYRILNTRLQNSKLAQLSRPRSPLMFPSLIVHALKSNKSLSMNSSSLATTSSSDITRQHTRTSSPHNDIQRINNAEAIRGNAKIHSNFSFNSNLPETEPVLYTTETSKLFEAFSTNDGENYRLRSSITEDFPTTANEYFRVTNKFYKPFNDILQSTTTVELNEEKIFNDMLDKFKPQTYTTEYFNNNEDNQVYFTSPIVPLYSFGRENDLKDFLDKISPEKYSSTVIKTKGTSPEILTRGLYEIVQVTRDNHDVDHFDWRRSDNGDALKSLKNVVEKLKVKAIQASNISADPGIISHDSSVEAFTDINNRFPKYNDVLKKTKGEHKRDISSFKSMYVNMGYE